MGKTRYPPRPPPHLICGVVKLIGHVAIAEYEVPPEQQLANTVELPQFPAGSGFSSNRDTDVNCIDIYEGQSMVAYIRIYANGKCRLTRKKETGLSYSDFDTYDDARAYVEAVLLLGIEPE